MAWTNKGDAVCDSCGASKPLTGDRSTAIQILIASSWHYASGHTLGGTPFEMISCTRCAHDERKRVQKKAHIQEETLPIDWEEWRKIERGQGFQSR